MATHEMCQTWIVIVKSGLGRVNRGVCGGLGGRGVRADDMTQMSWCSVRGLGCYTFEVN